MEEILVDNETVSEVKEEPENKTIWVTTNKRKEKIKIYVPEFNKFGHWKIAYEDGRQISDLKGSYTEKRDAALALRNWLRSTKKTKEAKHQEIFGDKQPPELKRKASARTGTTDDS